MNNIITITHGRSTMHGAEEQTLQVWHFRRSDGRAQPTIAASQQHSLMILARDQEEAQAKIETLFNLVPGRWRDGGAYTYRTTRSGYTYSLVPSNKTYEGVTI